MEVVCCLLAPGGCRKGEGVNPTTHTQKTPIQGLHYLVMLISSDFPQTNRVYIHGWASNVQPPHQKHVTKLSGCFLGHVINRAPRPGRVAGCRNLLWSLANTTRDLGLWEAGEHTPRLVGGSWDRSPHLSCACTSLPSSESVAWFLAACIKFVSPPGNTGKEARRGLKGWEQLSRKPPRSRTS